MNAYSALPQTLQSLLAGLLAASLSACAIVPGNKSYTVLEQSEVRIPVLKGEEIVPENVKVKQITAELIVEMVPAAAVTEEHQNAQ